MENSGESSRRLLVIGLDCAPPRFIFNEPDFGLPNLRALMADGIWGPLRSCDPPITVPAWSCMMSGRDPGELGVYGFRNRRDYRYDSQYVATSLDIHEKRVWDCLTEAGTRVCMVGVPQTYPVSVVNGCMVSGFLAPGLDSEFTYPPELNEEVLREVGEYLFDVDDFRTDDKPALLKRIYSFLHNRFDTAEYLIQAKEWDFFMMVEMGLDRLHHGFWRYCDPSHPDFAEDNPFRDVFKEYYEAMDVRIGRLLALIPESTSVLVVSDHGAKAMWGGFCINEWLIEEGYLALKGPVDPPEPLNAGLVDWERTRAWGDGGYYGRIFLNVEGREPQGIVPGGEVEFLLNELAEKLSIIDLPNGVRLNNRVLIPEDVYHEVRNVPPDLMVYFDDLSWRSVGLVGVNALYVSENDSGPDDANHDIEGVCILKDASLAQKGRVDSLNILDVAPTILAALGWEDLSSFSGQSLYNVRVLG